MKDLLLKPASKANSLKVVSYIGENPDRYKELVEIIVSNVPKLSEKASWAMSHCFDNRTGYFQDYMKQMAEVLAQPNYSDSVKRNIVRILQFVQIPEEYQASIIDSCFEMTLNKKSAIAVKAFSLGVLENMVKLYPELTNELKACIEDILPTASSGLKNRGQHILRRIS